MCLKAWQIGLDIQTGYARAIAVQRRRNGWQLRHWWQHPITEDILREGILYETAPLIAILSKWRSSLPRQISLRLSLPAQRIMQQRMPEPDMRLREPHRETYIKTSASKQLPLSQQSLVMDYRVDPCGERQLIVTAAQQKEVAQWQACLAQAGLFPQVMELAPCALQIAACAARLNAETLLIHPLDGGWMWASPWGLPFEFGVINAEEAPEFAQLRQAIVLQYRAGKLCEEGLYCSHIFDKPVPDVWKSWSPLRALTQMSPPLPTNPEAFAIAIGLALRADDG